MLYQYLKQIKQIYRKEHLNILLLDSSEIELYNKLQLFKNNIYILSKHDFDNVTIRYKYNATPVHSTDLPKLKFDITIPISIQELFYILNHINTQYIFYKNTIDTALYQKIPYIYTNKYLLKFSTAPKITESPKNTNNLQISKVIDTKKQLYLSQTAVFSNFPILIRSYNNVSKLYTMINSIYETNLYNSEIRIIDNKSDDTATLNFLNTFNKKIICDKLNEKIIQKTNIQQIPQHILGIKQKISVYQYNRHMQQCKQLLSTIKYGFQEFPYAPFIVILKDDLVFNKNWLTKLLKIYSTQKNIGIVSCYNKYPENVQNVQSYNIDTTCLLITKQFYNFLNQNKYFQKQYFNDCNFEIDNFSNVADDILRNMFQQYDIYENLHIAWYCKDAKLKSYITGTNFIQHIDNIIDSTLKIQYNPLTIKSLRRFMDISQSIFIFNNEELDETKIKYLTLYKTDLLVFLDNSYPIKYFKQHKNKIIFHSFENKTHKFLNEQNTDCKKYSLSSIYNNISKQQQQKITELMNNSLKIKNNFVILFLLMKIRFPNAKINLVNFQNIKNFTKQLNFIKTFQNINFINLNKNSKDFDWRDNFDYIYYLNNTNNKSEIDKLNEIRKTGLPGIKAFVIKNIFIDSYKSLLFNYLKSINKTIFTDLKQFVIAFTYYQCIQQAKILQANKILIINDDITFVKDLTKFNEIILKTPNSANIKIYDQEVIQSSQNNVYCMFDRIAIEKLLILFQQNLQPLNNYLKLLNTNNILNIN